MPLDPLTPKLMTQLSADAQIPTTQQLAHIDYIINSHIQAVTGIKYILAVSIIKYLNTFITEPLPVLWQNWTHHQRVFQGYFFHYQSPLCLCHRQELQCQVWHRVKKSVSSPQL